MANIEQDPYASPLHDSVPIFAKRSHIEYEAIQPNSVLRACARKQLQGVWGQMVLAFLVYFIIIFPSQFIFSEISPFHNSMMERIVSIAISLSAGPFSLGFAGYFLKRIRDEDITIGNIFDGFNHFFSSVLLAFFMGLFIILWSLLLVVPGIIKIFSYSMAYYIMYDNPEIGALEALRKSKIMMKGYKGKLFFLYLSFIGWFFLAAFTLFIGILWLAPYVNLSIANFYENLKRNQEGFSEDTETEHEQSFA